MLPPLESLAEAQRLLDAGRPFHAHEVLEGTWKAAPATSASCGRAWPSSRSGSPTGPGATRSARPGCSDGAPTASRRYGSRRRRTASTSAGLVAAARAIADEPLVAGEPPRTLRLRVEA